MGSLKNIRRMKMLAQGGRCYYCGLPMWEEGADPRLPPICRASILPKSLRCTAEHLLAQSEGGSNSAENIVAACLYCNSGRHRRKCPPSPEAFRSHARKRMVAGKWLAARVDSRLMLPRSDVSP